MKGREKRFCDPTAVVFSKKKTNKDSETSDSVLRYRQRRDQRLRARMDADDEGEWKTTDSGHKILIKDGTVVGGNPFTLASMGAPKDKPIPKSAKLSNDSRIDDFIRKNDRNQIADALSGRQGNCIFGGFYKVASEKQSVTFFNPHTGEQFSAYTTVQHTGPWGMEDIEDNLGKALNEIAQNEQVTKLYNRCSGIVQKGDKVRVVAGRTLAHGTEAKVRAVYEGKFGKYVYLDNGEKIQAKNVSIVDDDGTLIRTKEGTDHEGIKEAHEEYRARKKAEANPVTKEAITRAVGSSKTQKSIADALKKAGYKFEDRTGEMGSPDFKINNPDGGYGRVYVKGRGRDKEVVVQMWTPPKEEKPRPDYEIEGAKRSVKHFLKNYEKNPRKFENMDPGSQYAFVLAQSASFFLKQGMESKKAWSRAIGNAKAWADKDFQGYGHTEELDDQVKKVLRGIIDGLK